MAVLVSPTTIASIHPLFSYRNLLLEMALLTIIVPRTFAMVTSFTWSNTQVIV